jgi:transposase
MNKSEERSQKRKDVVEAIILRQEPVHLVARIYNIPQRTIFDWLSRYRSGGWDALKEGQRAGRKRKLSAQDMKWLYEAVTMGNPLNHQFDFCLWTLNIIREMLLRERDITLSKSSVSRLLGHLGLSPQRPIYKSYKQDPAKIEQYINKTFPEVAQQARELNAQIYFVDEASVRSDSHRGTTWGKAGETPVVKDSGGRFGLSVISGVTPRGDMRFSFIEGKMNSKRFIEFLKQLRGDARKPIIVIVDNARYHHSKETQAFIESQKDSDKGQIIMAFLPPYSPEYNPDEQVWNHAKARLAKLPIASKEAMKAALIRILRSIQKSKSLIKSFFKMKDTKYIAAAIA